MVKKFVIVENIEVIVQIMHRQSYNLHEYFINNFGVFNLQTYPSALIILPTKVKCI
jgi:hypothetical protein